MIPRAGAMVCSGTRSFCIAAPLVDQRHLPGIISTPGTPWADSAIRARAGIWCIAWGQRWLQDLTCLAQPLWMASGVQTARREGPTLGVWTLLCFKICVLRDWVPLELLGLFGSVWHSWGHTCLSLVCQDTLCAILLNCGWNTLHNCKTIN